MGLNAQIKAALRADRLGVIKAISKVASDPKAATRERLKAMELLMYLATGPSDRPAEDVDVIAAREARSALSNASAFLEEIIKSRRSGRVRMWATGLARRIDGIQRTSGRIRPLD